MATVAIHDPDSPVYGLRFTLHRRSEPATCTACRGETVACQPDIDDPDRMIEVCTECGEWIYRYDLGNGTVQRVAILSLIDAASPSSPIRPRLAE